MVTDQERADNRLYMRVWREANRESIRQRSAAFRAANRDKINKAYNRRYKQRIKAAALLTAQPGSAIMVPYEGLL